MYAVPAGLASSSGCAQDAKDQNRYTCTRYGATPGATGLHGMIMQWTPPLEAAGGVYKVCVVAEDDAPSAATRCFTFEVKRCMYCTDSESLSHVATRCRFVCFARTAPLLRAAPLLPAAPILPALLGAWPGVHLRARMLARSLVLMVWVADFEQVGFRSGLRMTRSG